MSDVKLSVVSGACDDVVTSAKKPEETKPMMAAAASGPTDDELVELAKQKLELPEEQYELIPVLIKRDTVRAKLVELWNKKNQAARAAEQAELEKKLATAEAMLFGRVEHQLIELNAGQKRAKKDVEAVEQAARYEAEQARKNARIEAETAERVAARAEAENITRNAIVSEFGGQFLPPDVLQKDRDMCYSAYRLFLSISISPPKPKKAAEAEKKVEESVVKEGDGNRKEPEEPPPSKEFVEYRQKLKADRKALLEALRRFVKFVHKVPCDDTGRFNYRFDKFWVLQDDVADRVDDAVDGFEMYDSILHPSWTEKEYQAEKARVEAEATKQAEREQQEAAEAAEAEAFKEEVAALLKRVGLDPTIAAGLIKRAKGKIVNSQEITPAGVLRRRAMRDGRDEGVSEEADRDFRIKLMTAVKTADLSDETVVMESATEAATKEVDELLNQLAEKEARVASEQAKAASKNAIPDGRSKNSGEGGKKPSGKGGKKKGDKKNK